MWLENWWSFVLSPLPPILQLISLAGIPIGICLMLAGASPALQHDFGKADVGTYRGDLDDLLAQEGLIFSLIGASMLSLGLVWSLLVIGFVFTAGYLVKSFKRQVEA